MFIVKARQLDAIEQIVATELSRYTLQVYGESPAGRNDECKRILLISEKTA
jgi:hypothetical protein